MSLSVSLLTLHVSLAVLQLPVLVLIQIDSRLSAAAVELARGWDHWRFAEKDPMFVVLEFGDAVEARTDQQESNARTWVRWEWVSRLRRDRTAALVEKLAVAVLVAAVLEA